MASNPKQTSIEMSINNLVELEKKTEIIIIEGIKTNTNFCRNFNK